MTFKYFTENPQTLIVEAFDKVHKESMQEMPFCASNINVASSNFQLMDGHWLGVLLTPWMISIMLLPSDQVSHPDREVTSKIGIQLANDNYTFTVGEQEGVGKYYACSIMSPLSGIASQEEAMTLVKELQRLITAIPMVDTSKRQLFTRKNDNDA